MFLAFIAIVLVIVLFIRVNALKKDMNRLKKTIEHLSEHIRRLTPDETAPYGGAFPSQEQTTNEGITPSQGQAHQVAVTPGGQVPSGAVTSTGMKQQGNYNIPTQKSAPAHQPAAFSGEMDTTAQPLRQETAPRQVIAPTPKKKPWFNNENWVGISLFNRLGALLIIIGTIAVAAFEGFPALLRTGVLFALAIIVIVLAEFMNRKKPTTFSTGLSATGVALNYVAIAASFFALETIGMYTALVACIVATALGIFLATRYSAQVIGCFALIGGYLPIFALDPLNNPMMIGVMVYFIILAAFSLILALTHKWSVMNVIGFALTVLGASYLGWQAEPVIGLAYACFAFLLYTALPLLANYRTKGEFTSLDYWMILLNTIIGSLVIFLIANRLELPNLHAYLCLIFAATYAILSYLAKRIFNHKNMTTLFTLTSIAFFVLFVPFFFSLRWFALFWLLQGVLLLSFGILREKKLPEFCGLTLLGFSALSIYMNNSIGDYLIFSSRMRLELEFVPHWQLTFDYSLFTLGVLAILGCYFAKGRQWRGYELAYKLFALANLWVFVMYLIFTYIPDHFSNLVVGHLALTSWAVVTFGFAYLYCRFKLLADTGTKILGNIIHMAGLGYLWVSTIELILTSVKPEGNNNIQLLINLFVVIVATSLVIHYHITEKGWTLAYKNINLVNLWLSSIVILGFLMRDFFGMQLVLIALTFIAGYIITRVSPLFDRAIPFIASGLYGIALIWLLYFNSWPYESNQLWTLLLMNGVLQIFALVAINDALHLWSAKIKGSSFKIIILSTYFLLSVTQGMMVQGNIAFSSATISIMYAVAAFIWIILGFKIKNKPTRKAGLFLSMAAVAKLLVIDTWGLSTGMRIVSYISLGILLMLISFVYQKLSKMLDE